MTTLNGLLPALTGNRKSGSSNRIFRISALPRRSIRSRSAMSARGTCGIMSTSCAAGIWCCSGRKARTPDCMRLARWWALPMRASRLEDGGPPAKWMRWRLDATLTPPVSKAELREHEALKGLCHFDAR